MRGLQPIVNLYDFAKENIILGSSTLGCLMYHALLLKHIWTYHIFIQVIILMAFFH